MSDMTPQQIRDMFGDAGDSMLEFLRLAEASEMRIRSTMTPAELTARDRLQAVEASSALIVEPARTSMSRAEFSERFFGPLDAA